MDTPFYICQFKGGKSSTRVPSKLVAFFIVLFQVSTGLSTVYAYPLEKHTLPFIENYNSSKMSLGYDELSDRETSLTDKAQPRAPLLIDNETWDILVPDDFPTIQEAVNNASEAQVFRIFVKAGVYNEHVVIATDGIVLHGEQKETTIIDGKHTGNVLSINCNYLSISGFTLKNGISGIFINQSSGNLIQDMIIKENIVGIEIHNHSHANNITENQVAQNSHDGIILNGFCTGNMIVANMISENSQCGITISSVCRLNMVTSNAINNNLVGINVTGVSDGNYFYSNSMIANILNAYDDSENGWDNGHIGNFWDDYTGVDTNSDGIGDTPYSIAGGQNKDNYPLMRQPADTYSSQLDTIIDHTKGIQSTISSVTSSGTTIYVPGDYPSIQEAVNHATDGDLIHIRTGIYHEHVIVDKQVNIEGEGADVTYIDGSGDNNHVFKITADNVDITGFTIQNCSVGFSGIRVLGDACIISDNILTLCGGGVELWDVDDAVLHHNTFKENTWGVYIHSSDQCQLDNNSFMGNLYGMELGYSTIKIIHNIIANHNVYGILQLWSNQAIIVGNTFEHQGNIAYLLYSSHHSIIERNDFEKNEYGLALYESSNNSILENNVSRNRYGLYIWFQSNNNCIDKNMIASNFYGIYIGQSNYNALSTNIIKNNTHDGVLIGFSAYYNIIMRNIISNNPQNGVHIFSSMDNTISKNNITGSNNGVDLTSYSSSIIIDNKLFNNTFGIFCSQSSHNYIENNDITNTHLNGTGIELFHSSNHNIIENNNISDNYYCIIIKNYCFNNIIAKNYFSNNKNQSIWCVDNCNYTLIDGNIMKNTMRGILFWNSSYNTICSNTLLNTTLIGIYINYLSSYCVVQDNTMAGGLYGIGCENSSNYNTISHNHVSACDMEGIYTYRYSHHNEIKENTVSNNGIVGIGISNSSWKNHVEHNVVTNNDLGIGIDTSSHFNTINGNSIVENNVGVVIKEFSQCNRICRNNIEKNGYGVKINLGFGYPTTLNMVDTNNFINNTHQVMFRQSFFTLWYGNYWDDWHEPRPRPIYGDIRMALFNGRIIPWVQFDWHPAQEPYEIPSEMS